MVVQLSLNSLVLFVNIFGVFLSCFVGQCKVRKYSFIQNSTRTQIWINMWQVQCGATLFLIRFLFTKRVKFIPPALVWYEIIRDFKAELRRQRQRINVNGKMHLLCFAKLHCDYFNRFLENSLKIYLKNPATKIHKASNCEVKRRSRALTVKKSFPFVRYNECLNL